MAKKAAAKKTAARAAAPARATAERASDPRLLKTELSKALAEIGNAYAAGTVRKGTESPLYNCIPTGAFPLDYALMGGIPEGLATLLFGREGSGKTTVTIGAVREIQQKYLDGMVLWIDAERTFDPEWAELHGVDLSRLYVVEPEDGQQAIDIITRFQHVLDCVGIVVDSIPALIPKALVDRSAYDVGMAELARLVGVLCSKSTSAWSAERKRGHFVTMILINQLRSAMNARLAHATSQPGGHQLQYFVTTRIRLTGKEVLASEVKKAEAEKYGLAIAEDKQGTQGATVQFVEHSFTITKAKIGSSLREGEFRMNVNPQHPYLGIGEYDNAKLAMLFAKRVGMLRGSAGRYYLHGVNEQDGSEGSTFRNFSAMEQWLSGDREARLRTQRILLAALRIHQKKPILPPDKYLLGHVANESVLWAARDFSQSAMSLESEDASEE